MQNYTHTIDLIEEEDLAFPLTEDEMQDIVDLVLSEEEVSRSCNVSISIVSDEEIQEINAKYREKNVVTDVISLECERPDDPDLAEGEPCELGDIILAPNYIEKQAKSFGTTFEDECRLLLVHALLHLLGYDHILEDEARIMEAREDELVALTKTDATLGHVELTRHIDD